MGLSATLFGPFSLNKNLFTLKILVFNVLLPCAAVLNVGFVSNLRDGLIWRFCGAFFMMRAIMLVGHIAFAALRRRKFEDIAVNWLVTCWVSSSILAPPLMEAVLGKEFQVLGPWSDVSSFLFQLPVVLCFFEIDSVRRQGSLENEEEQGKEMSVVPFYKTRLTRENALVMGKRLIKMPLAWAILSSVILSVTTLGPRYLYPGTSYAPNCDYVEYTGFIYLFFSYLASCLEPIALLSVGIVLSKNNPLTCGVWNIVGYTLIKFILVPMLMIGCSFAFSLDNASARGAVLIATLPISPPSFALAGHYEVGLAEAVSTVLSGKLLVIPAILAWQGFMDAVGLFPVDTPQVDIVCQGVLSS